MLARGAVLARHNRRRGLPQSGDNMSLCSLLIHPRPPLIFRHSPTARYAMKKVQAVRQHIAAALACVVLILAAGFGNAGNAARAGTGEPDFLVLNPENE